MPLVRRLVQGTDFKRFLDFVTPAFFDVMPARGLLSAARTLVSGYRNGESFERARQARQQSVRTLGLTVEVTKGPAGPSLDTLDEVARKEVGQAALQLYFHQIYAYDAPTLLNLSADRFSHDGERPRWSPSPGTVDWPQSFRQSLGDIYRAFYVDDDLPLEEALRPLGLSPAAELFRAHFGAGDQRAVRFEVEKFINAFHEVFLCCKKHGIQLEPSFLALGIYLATLYETLETVGVPLDARDAFEAVYSPTTPPSD